MNTYNWIGTIILLGSIQGIILMFAINKLKKGNRPVNKLLSVFVGLVTFTLIGKMVYHPNLIRKYMYFTFLSDIVIYLYGPFLYLYIKQLLHPNEAFRLTKEWRHFIMAFIFVFTCTLSLPGVFKTVHAHSFISFRSFAYYYWWVAMKVAIVHNIVYLVKSYRQISLYKRSSKDQVSYEVKLQYLKIVVGLVTCGITSWLLSSILISLKIHFPLIAHIYNIVWILAAFIIYVLGYFAMSRPEIFTLRPATAPRQNLEPIQVLPNKKKPVSTPPKKYSKSPLDTEKVARLNRQLEEYMSKHKPFLNATLTVHALAKMLQTNSSALSRVINECHQKNFFSFINSYRVQEFVKLAIQEKYQHYTYLALAYEVGFNSKSTFNKAFKKEHNKTPREYLKVVSESSFLDS